MKYLVCLGALAILTLSPALAPADPPPALAALADAAHDLTVASHAFTRSFDARGTSDRCFEDARTLDQAAARFEEEINVGPRILKADYDAVQQAFDQTRGDYCAGHGNQEDRAVQSAWIQTREANDRLVAAWHDHQLRRFAPPPPALPSTPPEPPLPM